MRRERKRPGRRFCAVLAPLVAMLAFSATAFGFSGEFSKFNNCPTKTAGVFKCLLSVTNGGSVILGKKTVPIVNAVTLQGGISKPNESFISTFYAASNGVTLSKAPQSVPGGLLGIVPPAGSPPLV